jgi:Skp family chaperone for outer membrane proteins
MATTFDCPCCDKNIRFQRAGAHVLMHKEEFYARGTNISAIKCALSKNLPYADITLPGKNVDVFMTICFCCDVAYKFDFSEKSSKHRTWMLKHTQAHPDHREGHLRKCEELLKEYNESYNTKNNEVVNKDDRYEAIIANKNAEIEMLKKEIEMMKKQASAGKPVQQTKRLDTTAERLEAKSEAIDKFCEVLDNYYGNTCHSDYYNYVSQQTFRYYVKNDMSEDTYESLIEDITDVSYFKTYLPGGENAPDGLY